MQFAHMMGHSYIQIPINTHAVKDTAFSSQNNIGSLSNTLTVEP